MSSKTSLLLSVDNEHWYHEGFGGSLILEINIKHCFNFKEGKAIVEIKEGTALHRAINTELLNRTECRKCGHSHNWETGKCNFTLHF